MDRAAVAKKLLDKGYIAEAREVLAMDPNTEKLSKIVVALNDMRMAASRVINAMIPLQGTDMDSDAIKQMRARLEKMISSYVE